MRRTPLARRTPLQARSHKKSRPRYTGPVRSTRELVMERDEYRCAVCGGGLLDGPYSIHHRRNRGSGGSRNPAINSPANLLLVCGTGTTGCHGWIGENPALATDAGYAVSLNSTADPAKVRVLHAVLGPVFLLHNGLAQEARGTA